MRVKAEAYKNYGDAALVSMVLEVLPHLAGEVMILNIMIMMILTKIMIMMKSGGEPVEADSGDCSSWRRQRARGEKPSSEQPGQYLDIGADGQIEEGGILGYWMFSTNPPSWS